MSSNLLTPAEFVNPIGLESDHYLQGLYGYVVNTRPIPFLLFCFFVDNPPLSANRIGWDPVPRNQLKAARASSLPISVISSGTEHR